MEEKLLDLDFLLQAFFALIAIGLGFKCQWWEDRYARLQVERDAYRSQLELAHKYIFKAREDPSILDNVLTINDVIVRTDHAKKETDHD